MLYNNGRPKRMLLESEIMAAQSISKTEAEASRKLGVSFMTYRKYAKMYGLYGRVVNAAGKGINKPIKNEDSGKYPLNHILEGKFPKYSTNRLKTRMIRSNRIEQKCNKCGFCEKRISDSVVPLLLNYIDANIKNKKRDNLELLCYNCYFLYINNPFGCKKTFKISDVDAKQLEKAPELSEQELDALKIQVHEEIKNESAQNL